MPDALILEFKGTEAQYQAVNDVLGLNMQTGEGEFPSGMRSHTGTTGDGSLIVFEVWDSKASQEAFMASRLGPALAEVGVVEPHRMEWLHVVGHHTV